MTCALTIRDDALWVKHVHDADIRRRLLALRADQPVQLLVDGQRIAFRKMKNGRDGRPTPGLRADDADLGGRTEWMKLQARRGETVALAIEEPSSRDSYLAYLDQFLWEWSTPEDAAAFDGL